MPFEDLRKKYAPFVDANTPKQEPVTVDEWTKFQESLYMVKIKTIRQAISKATDFLGSVGIGTMNASDEPIRNADRQVDPDAIPGAFEEKSIFSIGLMGQNTSPIAGFQPAIYIHFVTIRPHLSIFMYATDPKTGAYVRRGEWPVATITVEDVTAELESTIGFIFSSVEQALAAK
jgi:hypothetical protein